MRIFQTIRSTIRSNSGVLVLKNLQTKGGNLGELSEMVEALKENTEQVRKLNALLAPDLKRSEIRRESRERQAIPLSAESGDQYRS